MLEMVHSFIKTHSLKKKIYSTLTYWAIIYIIYVIHYRNWFAIIGSDAVNFYNTTQDQKHFPHLWWRRFLLLVLCVQEFDRRSNEIWCRVVQTQSANTHKTIENHRCFICARYDTLYQSSDHCVSITTTTKKNASVHQRISWEAQRVRVSQFPCIWTAIFFVRGYFSIHMIFEYGRAFGRFHSDFWRTFQNATSGFSVPNSVVVLERPVSWTLFINRSSTCHIL